MNERQENVKKVVEELTKRFVDEGKIVEAGWEGFKLMVISPHAPEDQLKEMRLAFFGGAHHLFASILNMMTASSEPTPEDEDRMDKIATELRQFEKELKESMHG